MKPSRPLCALVLACIAPLAAAQAYKCTQGGTTTYQDKPCPAGGGTKMDLPGAYTPPLLAGGSLAGYSPQDVAFALAFDRAMVQRCPLGAVTSTRLDALAAAIAPVVRPVSSAQLAAVEAKASQRANELVASPNRATACRLIDGSIETSFQKLADAVNADQRRGPRKTL